MYAIDYRNTSFVNNVKILIFDTFVCLSVISMAFVFQEASF